jgi:hypothetical protein
MSHTLAKAPPHFFEHGRTAAVFDYIVQQRRDGEIFIASRFEDETGHDQ